MKVKIFNKYIAMLMLLFLTIPCMIGCGEKEEDYRQIQVYKIDGTAMVARQGSSMDAYENMQLQSGDVIETIAESYLQLKLDEDKYILIEPESKISLQATGNSVDSKTKIHLEKGAVVNQLDNPLNENSSYEITTPNSTMAVRGTTFRVEITLDENGESHTKVAVYGGKVECNLVFPDGTIAEPVLVEKGTEVLIWGDDTQTEYVGTGNVSYEEMKTMVIDFLGEIVDRGEELSVTQEELIEIKQAIELLEEETSEEEVAEEDVVEEIMEEEKLDEDASEEDNSAEDSVAERNAEEIIEDLTNGLKPEEENKQPEVQIPVIKPSNPSDGGGTSTPTPTPTPNPEPTPDPEPSPDPEPEPAQTRCVYINFVLKYGETEEVFATKVMEDVSTEALQIEIIKPLLLPDTNGSGGYWIKSETDVWGDVNESSYFGDSNVKESLESGTEDVTITFYWWAGVPE